MKYTKKTIHLWKGTYVRKVGTPPNEKSYTGTDYRFDINLAGFVLHIRWFFPKKEKVV